MVAHPEDRCADCDEGMCHGHMCDGPQGCRCPPLYKSGIHWIDNAYEVVRQLRQEMGLPDIRPLLDRPRDG